MYSSRMCTACSNSHGGVCLSACWDPPPHPLGVGLETPPGVAWRPSPGHTPQYPPLGVGLETPCRPDPSTSPLGVDLETCKACWDTSPPRDLLQGMLGYHLQCMLGYHPPP